MKRIDANEVWIGFVHVQPLGEPNPFGEDRKGALTHALALATSLEQYQQRVVQSLHDHGLVAIECSDVATFAKYASQDRISEDMQEMVDNVTADRLVQFDVFDTYRDHDS